MNILDRINRCMPGIGLHRYTGVHRYTRLRRCSGTVYIYTGASVFWVASMYWIASVYWFPQRRTTNHSEQLMHYSPSACIGECRVSPPNGSQESTRLPSSPPLSLALLVLCETRLLMGFHDVIGRLYVTSNILAASTGRPNR